MENIVVPTPGCWNINDIYSPNELVKEGKLVKKENGQLCRSQPRQVPQRQVIQALLPKRRTRTAGSPLFVQRRPQARWKARLGPLTAEGWGDTYAAGRAEPPPRTAGTDGAAEVTPRRAAEGRSVP